MMSQHDVPPAEAAPETAASPTIGSEAGLELDAEDTEDAEDADRRIIKRYSNRKLYDTKDSRYVTLLQIAELVRAGEEVQIIDNSTKEDKTDVTLALIISEELKSRPRGIPIATLKALIRHRGGKWLTSLKGSPVGRFIPKEGSHDAGPSELADGEQVTGEQLTGPQAAGDNMAADDSATHDGVAQPTPQAQSAFRRTLEQWQHTIDERLRATRADMGLVKELQAQIEQLTARVQELEQQLTSKNQ
jgi:polyhydroxyalkanoate synthesis repressor PhaR